MKLIISLVLSLLLTNCGNKGIQGSIGLPGNDGLSGKDGEKGDTGAAGNNGQNGLTTLIVTLPSDSCSNDGVTLLTGLDLNQNQVLSIDEVNSSADICNGNPGEDGLDAVPTPFTPIGLLNPCGDNPNLHDEVFLQLSNGIIVASFSENVNGKNTRFSILTPGSYVTTDNDHCSFSVDLNGVIYNESHIYE